MRKKGEEVLAMLRHGDTGQHRFTLFAWGTFSTLQVGHAAIIAFDVSENVLVGVSSDHFASTLGKKLPILTYEERKRNLRNFLSKHG